MGDQDDVRTRVDDALRRAASVAYEAAHGAIDERPDDDGPARWRVLMRPRAAVTAAFATAVVAMVVVYGPWEGRGEAASLSPVTSNSAAATTAAVAVPGGAPPGGSVVVDVAGAVARPGVVTLDAGSRVTHAIDHAGGALDDADLERLNLARVLVDGEQVLVPRVGEPGAVVGGSGPGGSAVSVDGRININGADATALEDLPGVGPVLAQRIVEYRDRNGPFASVEGLDAVKGVGPSVLEGLADAATV